MGKVKKLKFNKTKNWEDIDVEKTLSLEDFNILFSKVSLTKEEKKGLKDYYMMYESFIKAEVEPIEAWKAIKGIFVIKNPQIRERINK
jgi:hypothetical protein